MKPKLIDMIILAPIFLNIILSFVGGYFLGSFNVAFLAFGLILGTLNIIIFWLAVIEITLLNKGGA